MWKPHATAEDENGQIWRAPAGKAAQSLDPGAGPGAWSFCSPSGVALFGKPCQGSCISGFFPCRGAQGGRQRSSAAENTNQFPTPSSPSLQLLGSGSPWEGLPSPFASAPQQAGRATALSRGAGGWLWLTFGFKSKVTVLADVRPDVCVRANVFLQHAGFLAANSTLLTNILPSSTASHIHILFV